MSKRASRATRTPQRSSTVKPITTRSTPPTTLQDSTIDATDELLPEVEDTTPRLVQQNLPRTRRQVAEAQGFDVSLGSLGGGMAGIVGLDEIDRGRELTDDEIADLDTEETYTDIAPVAVAPKPRTTTPRPVATVATPRRTPGKRIPPNVKKELSISRQEEYSFIKADLLAVFLLTMLMIIILVALTFIIGR